MQLAAKLRLKKYNLVVLRPWYLTYVDIWYFAAAVYKYLENCCRNVAQILKPRKDILRRDILVYVVTCGVQEYLSVL